MSKKYQKFGSGWMKQTGRKWDDVYSEICENLDAGNLVQQHVISHITNYVVINVYKAEDGKLYEISRWKRRQPIIETYALLYVDPDTGILIKNPGMPRSNLKNIPGTRAYEREQERLKQTPKFYILDNGDELHQLNGIWYGFVWDVVPPADESEHVAEYGSIVIVRTAKYRTDALTGGSYSSGQKYRTNKHQLNSKELRQHGLTNIVV